MIDIRHLRYFQAVARELHFGRAAARLYVAQPALSRQVKQLEEEVGTPLLRRTQRTVELLPAGRVFLERVDLILEEIERAALDARRTSAGEFGKLAIGFIHSSTYGLLPSILERFRQLFPDVQLDLHEMTIVEQHVALASGAIDVGLLRPQPGPGGLDFEVILEDRFFVVVHSKHPLASRKSVSLKALAGEPVVAFPHSGYTLFNSRMMAMCAEAGFAPKIVQYAEQIHTVVGLVGAGIGIAIVPGTARNLNSRNVHFLEIVDRPEPVHVAVGWLRGKKDAPAILAFRRVAAEVARKASQGGKRVTK